MRHVNLRLVRSAEVFRARVVIGQCSTVYVGHKIVQQQRRSNFARFFEVISHGVASRSVHAQEQTAVACFCLNHLAGRFIERQVIFVIRLVFGRDVVKITLIHNHVVIANGRVELFELRVDSERLLQCAFFTFVRIHPGIRTQRSAIHVV